MSNAPRVAEINVEHLLKRAGAVLDHLERLDRNLDDPGWRKRALSLGSRRSRAKYRARIEAREEPDPPAGGIISPELIKVSRMLELSASFFPFARGLALYEFRRVDTVISEGQPTKAAEPRLLKFELDEISNAIRGSLQALSELQRRAELWRAGSRPLLQRLSGISATDDPWIRVTRDVVIAIGNLWVSLEQVEEESVRPGLLAAVQGTAPLVETWRLRLSNRSDSLRALSVCDSLLSLLQDLREQNRGGLATFNVASRLGAVWHHGIRQLLLTCAQDVRLPEAIGPASEAERIDAFYGDFYDPQDDFVTILRGSGEPDEVAPLPGKGTGAEAGPGNEPRLSGIEVNVLRHMGLQVVKTVSIRDVYENHDEGHSRSVCATALKRLESFGLVNRPRGPKKGYAITVEGRAILDKLGTN